MRQNQNLTFSITLLKWDCFFVLFYFELILCQFLSLTNYMVWYIYCISYLVSTTDIYTIICIPLSWHKKEKLTSIRPLVLPTQLSSKESRSKSECDEDDFSTLELRHGSKDSAYNEDMYVVQSMDGELDHECGDSASLNGLTKVCWFCTHSLFWLLST